MKTKLKSYGYFLGIAIVGIVIGAFLQGVRAWQEPSGAPSSTNIIGAPINTSTTNQVKSGVFTAGALVSPTVCIGSDCKSAWPSATGGDNLGNHTATQSLNMNGNAITGASSVAVNIGGINFTLKYANAQEDTYGAPSSGGASDTCDGNTSAEYQCKVNEGKTCVDVSNSWYSVSCGNDDPSCFTGSPGKRTVVCKRTLVFSE